MKRVAILLTGLVGGYQVFKEDRLKVDGPKYQLQPKCEGDLRFNTHFITREVKTVGVIGGGRSGLIVAKTLCEQGYKVEVLERKLSSQNEGLHLARKRLPFFYQSLPDFPFKPNSFVPSPKDLENFYKAFALNFKLKALIKYNSEVTGIFQNIDGSWVVETHSGTKKYDLLVLATGLHALARTPKIPGIENFNGEIIHSSEFLRGETQLEGKDVVILGSDADCIDSVIFAAEKAKSTTHLVNKLHWPQLLPENIVSANQDGTLDWKLYLSPVKGLTLTRLGTAFEPNYYPSQYDYLVKPLKSIYWYLQWAASALSLPMILHGDSDILSDNLLLRAGYDPKYIELVKAHAVGLQRGKLIVEETGVLTEKGFIKANIIVLATGYHAQTFHLPSEADGQWMYRNTICPGVTNLAIVGLVDTRYSALVTNLQAVWLAEVLRGRVLLPDVKAMKEDCIIRRDYVRRVLGERIQLSSSWPSRPLIDQLLTDMSLRTNRKPSIWKNWTTPLQAADYEGVIVYRT